MNSWSVAISLIILFILVSVAIILSIIALVMTNRNNKGKPFSVMEFEGLGSDNFFELNNTTYFYYNILSNASLKLMGKKGISVIITNDSDNIVKVIPEENTKFKLRGRSIEKFDIQGGKSIIIVWSEDDTARIIRI